MDIMNGIDVTWDNIIDLAMQCHAIDATAYSLFEHSTIDDKEYVKSKYNEMLSKCLLNLAITTRVKFYQGIPHEPTSAYVNHSGFMYKYANNREHTVNFSIKDVCDKIIHANYVIKFTDEEDPFTITSIYAVDKNNPPNMLWMLEFSVTLFTQGVINWAVKQIRAETK